jgi:hypothetical protein
VCVAEVLPEEVKGSVARSRAVRMLQTTLGHSMRLSTSKTVCATTAAVWLEGKVYEALCAQAIENSNHTILQHAPNSLPSSTSRGDLSSSGAGAGAGAVGGTGTSTGLRPSNGGEAAVATHTAVSAFNRYLANVTRLTFALQVCYK